MSGPPLRIALILNETTGLPHWIVRLMSRIDTMAGMEICGIIGPAPPAKPQRTNFLYRLSHRAERSIAAQGSLATRHSASDLTAGIPQIEGFDEVAIRALEADVLLDLSGNHGLAHPASAARLGIWFTNVTPSVEGAAGLRPLLQRRPVSAITLYRRMGKHPLPTEIASAAVNTKFVAARNAWFLKEKSVTLILRELKRASRLGDVQSQGGSALFVPPRPPDLRETLTYLRGMLGEVVARTFTRLAENLNLRPGMFQIMTMRGDLATFDPAAAQPIRPQGNTFQADPFLLERDGEIWCFLETYDFDIKRGYISAGRLENDELVDVRTVLDAGYHMSFPFLLEDGGDLFMMPEVAANKRVEVWRCTNFPDQWELHATALRDTNVADATLTKIDGQWWLFANLADDPFGEVNSELHLFKASGPNLNKLEPHRFNPVVFDSRYARNGGRIHVRDDKLFRSAQDNSHGTYGYGFHLMQIEELSMENYRESSYRHIEPNFMRGLIGSHHFDILDGRIVFDVRRRMGGRG